MRFKIGDKVRFLAENEIDKEKLPCSLEATIEYRNKYMFSSSMFYKIMHIDTNIGEPYFIVLADKNGVDAFFSEYELQIVPKYSIKELYEQ